MRHKCKRHGPASSECELLPDLAQVSVHRHAVAAHTSIHLAEKKRDAGIAARSTGTAHAGDCDGVRAEKVGLQQRNQGQKDARGITTWAGDDPRRFNLVCPNFRQRINSLGKKLGRRVLVRIILLINGGIPQPKIGTEIDDLQAQFQKRSRILDRNSMWKREKGNLCTSRLDGLGIRRSEFQRVRIPNSTESRKLSRQTFPGE
jgi:hypothetical protein